MRIGWIGTGVMGAPMAGHLQDHGHDLLVFNRTRLKAEGLLRAGAEWCDTPRAVAEGSEILFSMVGLPDDVRQTYFGNEGVLTAVDPAGVIIDMTTSQPALAQEIAGAAAGRGIRSLDAPVSGGDIGARNGRLAIMVGGDRSAFDEAMPLLRLMGESIAYLGPAGAGQHTKMCNQILIAGTMVGVCESLLYATKSGLEPQAVIDIIGKGAAGSWAINTLGPRIVAGNYDPGFFVEHFIKDMGIALAEAKSMGLCLPGLALVHQLYLAVQAQGGGRDGTQALMKALARMSGMEPGIPKTTVGTP